MEQSEQDQAEACFKKIQEQTSSDLMKMDMENNSSNKHSNNIDQHRTSTAQSQSTAAGQQQGQQVGSNSESIDETKERLQRFDLVIQHLHRLRATLALDSSVRELQKLQTLNILGQNLFNPSEKGW